MSRPVRARASIPGPLERMEGASSHRVRQVGEQTAQPPAQLGADFEVTVAPELGATHEEGMVVEWLDPWR